MLAKIHRLEKCTRGAFTLNNFDKNGISPWISLMLIISNIHERPYKNRWMDLLIHSVLCPTLAMDKYFALLALVALLAQDTFQYQQTKVRRSVSQSNRNYECGVRKQHIVGDLITNGSNATAGEWPWHGAVFQRKSRRSREYMCGATLIHENFAITVRRCVVDRESGYEVSARLLTVDFGNVQLLGSSSHGQTHRVLEIFLHPQFTIDSNKHDVAILSLVSRVSFSNYVVPICLGYNSSKTSIHDIVGKVGVVVGWSPTEEDVASINLKQSNVPVVDHAECLKTDPELFGPIVYPGMFCAGYRNGTNVCNGDNGGGMYFENEQKWFLRGITSFSTILEAGSNKCDVKNYAGFINVQYYASWIRHTVDDASNMD
ncbi:hypothetical protein RP20_CCG003619 [Aedes albopictus]|nr:hypothetical protein RP20_CCG003619 [Aedes albopictus]